MPGFVLKDASVKINSVVLSDHARSVTVNYSAEVQDATCMNPDGTKSKVSGLKDWTLDIEFAQDFATGSVDATLFPLVGGAAVPIEIKPTSAATSPTNPAYAGNGIVQSYPPLGGAVGALATTTVRIEGTGLLTRATA